MTLEAIDATGSVLVRLPDGLVAPARVSSHLDPAGVRHAAASRGTAVALLQPGDPRPVLIGLVEEGLEPLRAAAVEAPSRGAPVEANVAGDQSLAAIARVDGRRVAITAYDEVVLCCGKASISLRRDGRVVVKGTRIETDADGVNRIKGASVRIN